MTMRFLRQPAVPAMLALLAIFAGIGLAQTTSGDMTGTVFDAAGAAIPAATVTVENQDTGVKATATTSGEGIYRFRNLLIGRYTLSASAAGFAATTLKDVEVLLNTTITTNLTLQVGTTTTTVEVTSAPPSIDTTTSQLQNTYSSQEILALPQAAFSGPTATAGIANLSLLNAGVSTQTGSGYGVGPSVGGQRPTNNSFNVEGIDNNDKGVTGPVVQVPVDAIGQFSILLNNFNPEFGFSTGGIFNTNIKSGTNAIHGSVYEYFQNRDLNAVDQQTVRQGFTSNQRFDDNRLGANIGGPVLKNKLFYFGDFEYNPIGQAPTPGSVINAPTAAGYTALGGIAGVSKTNLGVLQKFLPAAPSADPTSVISVGGLSVPNGPISVVGPSFQNQYNVVASGDWNISDRDQFRLRYIYNKLDIIDTAANLPVFWGTSPNYVHLVSAAEFHNFSPTLTNEFRLSYSRRFNNYTSPDFSFPGLDVFPNLYLTDLNVQLGPNQNDPQGYIQNVSQLTDNLTKVLGNHTFKAGYEIHDVIASNTFIQRARGDYEYNDLSTFLFDKSPDVIAERSYGTAGGNSGRLSAA